MGLLKEKHLKFCTSGGHSTRRDLLLPLFCRFGRQRFQTVLTALVIVCYTNAALLGMQLPHEPLYIPGTISSINK